MTSRRIGFVPGEMEWRRIIEHTPGINLFALAAASAGKKKRRRRSSSPARSGKKKVSKYPQSPLNLQSCEEKNSSLCLESSRVLGGIQTKGNQFPSHFFSSCSVGKKRFPPPRIASSAFSVDFPKGQKTNFHFSNKYYLKV